MIAKIRARIGKLTLMFQFSSLSIPLILHDSNDCFECYDLENIYLIFVFTLHLLKLLNFLSTLFTITHSICMLDSPMQFTEDRY